MYKLMVVDDEYHIRDGIVHVIPWEQHGVKVVGEAADGMEALAKMETLRPDILITDIQMDEMNGLELAQAVKTSYPGVKTVILTGYDEFEYARKAVELKICSYVLKPVLPDELVRLVNGITAELDEGRRVQAQLARIAREDVEASVRPLPPEGGSRSVIRRARDYIEGRYADPDLSLAAIAGHLFLTPAYFSKLYKDETGESYIEFVTDMRLREAKRLLRETNVKIVKVGEAVGYRNAQYFCTLFKRSVGVSPADYRQREGARDAAE
ncbi:MAG: response regulator [Paenibacillaceae bacterium]|nr:response regulator [Paenibacillaceae bacterium]